MPTQKKHRGEFTEWGRRLVATRNTAAESEDFRDAFILEAVEANGCLCGGAVSDDGIDVVVELGRMSEGPEAKFSGITAWLEARPDIESWRAGPLFDLWYGDFDEIEDEKGQDPADHSS